jgi:hypothetical protein
MFYFLEVEGVDKPFPRGPAGQVMALLELMNMGVPMVTS